MIKIGLVTVSYNSAKVIREFMDSLLPQSYTNWRLYLIDSHSSDETLAILAKYPDSRISIRAESSNVGFARGSNLGIKQALAENCSAIMLINNDVEFAVNFLEQMVEELELSAAEIIAPKMLYFQPPARIWCAGGGFMSQNAWAAYHTGINALDNGQFDSNCYCEFVPLCCALIKAECFEQIGDLDEKYFIYSEDADWFYRAKQAKLRLKYCFRPVILHKVSSLTGGLSSKFAVQIGTRNRVYFIRKNFSGKLRWGYLAKYFVGMFYFLAKGKYSWREFRWRIPAFFRGLSY